MRRYLRLKRFEQDTPDGRSAERYRRATLSAVADAAAKGCAMGLIFVSVAVTIPYLGPERFGIWATIASLTAMLSLLDLGMGNALINRIAAASVDCNKALLVNVASGGLVTLAILGAVVGIILTCIAGIVPWEKIIKLDDRGNIEEMRQAAIVFGVLFGCNIAATGVRSLFIGLQCAYISHLAMAVGYIAAIISIWFAADAKSSVPTLLLVTFGMQILSALALVFIAASRKLLNWVSFSVIVSEARALVRVGSLFLILQIGAMIAWGGDSLMIAHVRGANDVAVFNIVQRVFLVVAMPMALLSAPLWSAYAEAKTRNEYDFMERTLKANLSLVLTVGLIGVLSIMSIAEFVIFWLTGGLIEAPFSLIVAFSILTIIQGLGSSLGVYLNGSGIIKAQIFAVLPLVIFGFPLKYVFLSEYGLTSFVVCSILVYVATHGLVYGALYFRYRFAKEKANG